MTKDAYLKIPERSSTAHSVLERKAGKLTTAVPQTIRTTEARAAHRPQVGGGRLCSSLPCISPQQVCLCFSASCQGPAFSHRLEGETLTGSHSPLALGGKKTPVWSPPGCGPGPALTQLVGKAGAGLAPLWTSLRPLSPARCGEALPARPLRELLQDAIRST